MSEPVGAQPLRRDVGLDGLRGIAILLVLVHHFVRLAPEQGVLGEVLLFVGRASYVGIDLFFVLSGFLITRILLGARGRSGAFQAFYARRLLRTVPVYALVLLGVMHLAPLVLPEYQTARWWLPEGPVSPLWYWTWTSNVAVAIEGDFFHRLLGVTWSLAVEEQFYLLWPLIVLRGDPRRLGRLCAGLFFGALALRSGGLLAGLSDEAIYVLMPARMDTLAAGAWLAVRHVEGRSEWTLRRARQLTWPLALATLALFTLVWLDRFDDRHRESLFLEDWRVQTLGYSLTALLAAAIVIRSMALTPGGVAERILHSRVVQSFGQTSYAVYLTHMIVLWALEKTLLAKLFSDAGRIEGGLSPAAQVALLPAAIGLSWLVGVISWWALEERVLRLKRHFVTGPPPDSDRNRPAAR